MEEAKRRGLCRHIGVSNYPVAFMKDRGDVGVMGLTPGVKGVVSVTTVLPCLVAWGVALVLVQVFLGGSSPRTAPNQSKSPSRKLISPSKAVLVRSPRKELSRQPDSLEQPKGILEIGQCPNSAGRVINFGMCYSPKSVQALGGPQAKKFEPPRDLEQFFLPGRDSDPCSWVRKPRYFLGVLCVLSADAGGLLI